MIEVSVTASYTDVVNEKRRYGVIDREVRAQIKDRSGKQDKRWKAKVENGYQNEYPRHEEVAGTVETYRKIIKFYGEI